MVKLLFSLKLYMPKSADLLKLVEFCGVPWRPRTATNSTWTYNVFDLNDSIFVMNVLFS